MLPVFLRTFGKRSSALFALVKLESEIVENGLLGGSERKKRLMAALR